MDQGIQKAIDKYIGGALNILLGLPSTLFRRAPPKDPKRILLVKLWAVGESVISLPLAKALRKKYPDASIDALVRNSNRTVYSSSSLINDILLFEPTHLLSLVRKLRSYDVVIDLEPYLNVSALLSWWLGKSRIGFDHGTRALLYTTRVAFDDCKHEAHTYLDLGRALGADYTPERLERLNWGNYVENSMKGLLAKELSPGQPLIGICATTAKSATHRAWPAERFAQLAKRLIEEHNAKILFVGTKDDLQTYSRIQEQIGHPQHILNLSGKTNLKEAFYLIAQCKLFISNDTGPMHIAAAQRVPTIGLFGPNLPLRFAPFGKNNTSIYHQLPCSPCVNVHKGSFPPCVQKEKGRCMRLISVEEVYQKAKEALTCKTR